MDSKYDESVLVILLLALVGSLNLAICDETTEKINHNQSETSTTECYLPNRRDSTTAWRLVYENDFNQNLTADDWDIQNEAIFCGGNGIQQVSCNVARNVRVLDGVLALFAQFESYFEYQYTGATITTKRNFTYGRWELRAAQPRGRQLRSSIFTRPAGEEAYWHELGQMDVESNTGEPFVYRGVHYANSASSYAAADHLMAPVSGANHLTDFHLYGLEWDPSGVRFFFDESFSEMIRFDNASKGMYARHHLRLQIGVGGRLFAKPMPAGFEQLAWRCPAFMLDYIRIFERIPNSDRNETLPECEKIGIRDNQTRVVMDDICARAMEHLEINEEPPLVKSGNLIKNNWLPIAIFLLLIIFLAVLIYLVIQIARVKRRVVEQRPLETYPYGDSYHQADEYYENVYDAADIDVYLDVQDQEGKGDVGDSVGYVQSGGQHRYEEPYKEPRYSILAKGGGGREAGNDYLEIKNDISKRNETVVGEYETLATTPTITTGNRNT